MAKLAIVGTGFTGASLGLALRPSKLFDEIAGYSRDRGRLQAAKRVGAIDDEARSAAAAAEGAAVVVIAVPGQELEEAFREIAPALAAGAVVTDTSRWKLPAQKRAAVHLPASAHFIGGRPVLDNRGHGPEQANPEVFRNAVYCLTPMPEADAAAINALSAVVTAAGAQPYFLDPAEHDALTTAGELLPAVALASLAMAITGDQSWTDASRLAGDRFNRLVVLVEELPPSLWHEAAESSVEVARWLDTAAASLLDLRDRLRPGAGDELAGEWQATLDVLARWRHDKRQLQESTMPPKSALKPNLFGSFKLTRRGGTEAD